MFITIIGLNLNVIKYWYNIHHNLEKSSKQLPYWDVKNIFQYKIFIINFNLINQLQNNQYILFQQNHTIILYQQGKLAVFQYDHKIQLNSLLQFNADSELFSLNQVIKVYQVQNPSLQINLINLQVTNNSFTFSIMCFSQEMFEKYNLYILPKDNTNIYVMFNQEFPQYQYTTGTNISGNFFSYSGKLLQYSQNNDTSYFFFHNTTYYQIGQIQQNFNLVSQLQIIQNINETYFFLQDIIIYHYLFSITLTIIKILIFRIIHPSIFQFLQMQIQFRLLIAFILKLQQQVQVIIRQSIQFNTSISINKTFESEILEFIVTYNNLIILFINQEIQIMSLDFQKCFTLNQDYINKFFINKTIYFNPKQLIMNTQLLSSFLYINNVQEVIIISIQQNNIPIRIELIQVNFRIKQINLVNQQLILSHICWNDQAICFQVLNVQNLPNYCYVKNLSEVENNDKTIITSDNLFLYITFANNTVYIYNPSLPQHMSLYYQLKLNSTILCTLAIQYQKSFFFDNSIIFYQNAFYQLEQIQSINIQINDFDQSFNHTLPKIIYNYTVISALNNSALQQTPNQSIISLSHFMIFQHNKTIIINLTLNDQNNRNNYLSYPISLIADRQYNSCQLHDLSHFQIKDIFKIDKLLTKGCWITAYKYSYNHQHKLNFTHCLASTSDNQNLYSICQNNTTQYLINLTLNSSGYIVKNTITKIPLLFSNIFKMKGIINQIFILGNLKKQSQFLYWFNQSNNSFIQLTQKFSYQSDDLFYCQDFSAGFLNNFGQINRIIIFQTIMNQLFYQIMEIEEENISIQPLVYVIIHYCNFQYSCYVMDQFKYILIIRNTYENVIILLTDKSNYSYLIRVIINSQKIQYSNNLATVLKIIPNILDFYSTGNSIYFEGTLMQQFRYKNQSNYNIGIYYLGNLESLNIEEPILMQGSFYQTNSQYAMIVNQKYQNEISLYISSGKAQFHLFSTQNITCNLHRKTKSINVTLTCENWIYQRNYTIIFNLVAAPSKNIGWIIGLLIIISLLLFYFCYKVKHKTQGINVEIEL
ncbi:unnamed protein product [Paramecium sonneborni]|uniref:Transmembrane protein n=1 Tax=Paramecium sonneborni TaxID=65129 RepID=A0A8S1RS27_9CILI|nr:unnamed protein product [Paramecium sonneborni]